MVGVFYFNLLSRKGYLKVRIVCMCHWLIILKFQNEGLFQMTRATIVSVTYMSCTFDLALRQNISVQHFCE